MVAKAVVQLAAVVRRRQHDDTVNVVDREAASSDGSAQHDPAHRMGHDVDRPGDGRDLVNTATDVLREMFDWRSA
jgi:hypothetical protein